MTIPRTIKGICFPYSAESATRSSIECVGCGHAVAVSGVSGSLTKRHALDHSGAAVRSGPVIEIECGSR